MDPNGIPIAHQALAMPLSSFNNLFSDSSAGVAYGVTGLETCPVQIARFRQLSNGSVVIDATAQLSSAQMPCQQINDAIGAVVSPNKKFLYLAMWTSHVVFDLEAMKVRAAVTFHDMAGANGCVSPWSVSSGDFYIFCSTLDPLNNDFESWWLYQLTADLDVAAKANVTQLFSQWNFWAGQPSLWNSTHVMLEDLWCGQPTLPRPSSPPSPSSISPTPPQKTASY